MTTYLRLFLLFFLLLTSTALAADNSLHDAAKAGDIAKVRALLDQGADINAKDKDGWTPLHRAGDGGNKEVAELLIAKGADVNTKDNYGETPLHRAAIFGNKEVAELLIAKGADINAKEKDGQTPLHQAAIFGKKELAEFLLAKGADINAKEKYGDTPLHLAVRYDKKELVELLIAKGADINAKNEDGETPLHQAAYKGNKELVELLIAKGADINAKSKYGGTPLHWAIGKKELAELLIAKGADINAKNKDGETPLTFAAYKGNKEVAELLIAKGADINAKNKDGETPLHQAAYKGNKEVAELLIAKGADITAKEQFGRTPLTLAVNEGKKEVAELIKNYIIHNPHEVLKHLTIHLHGNPGNTALREEIIKLALTMKPEPGVPEEAEKLEGRAQYAFKNAKSESEMLDAAREYLKAVDAAPWVLGYYHDLCVILEKANQMKEAIRACKMYLTVPDANDAGDIRRRIAGFEYALEKERNSYLSRRECKAGSDMYEDGAKKSTIGGKQINLKLITSSYGGVLRNQVMVVDISNDSANLKRFDLDPTVQYFQLNGRGYRFTVDKDGRISLGGQGSPQAEITTNIDELVQLRKAQLSKCLIAKKGDDVFVLLAQGGPEGYGNDGALVYGWLGFKADCRGNLTGDKPAWLVPPSGVSDFIPVYGPESCAPPQGLGWLSN